MTIDEKIISWEKRGENMILEKVRYISSGGGNTNYTEVTWKQSGSIVEVTVRGLEPSGQIQITGLPIPQNESYVYAAMLTANLDAVAGYVQYSPTNHVFYAARTVASGKMYGTFTYITG